MPPVPNPLSNKQMESAWKDLEQTAELTTLDRIKDLGTSRITMVTALIALSSTIGLVISPEKFLDNTLDVLIPISIAFLAFGITAIISLYYAHKSVSEDAKIVNLDGTGDQYRDNIIKNAERSAKDINFSRVSLTWSLGFLMFAVVFYLLLPGIHKSINPTYSFMKLGDGTVVCGKVVEQDDGRIFLETIKDKGFPFTQIPTKSSNVICPPKRVLTEGKVYKMYSTLNIAGRRFCGEVTTLADGSLWFKTSNSSGILINESAVLKPIASCPPSEMSLSKNIPTYTYVSVKDKGKWCGQLATKADGSLWLSVNSKPVYQIPFDADIVTSYIECPRLKN